MHLARITLTTLLAVSLLAAASTPVLAQQFRERFRQQMEQHQAQTSQEQARQQALPAGSRVQRNLAYGTDSEQRYDVYLPARLAPNAPILFMVHGGGWRRGDKARAPVVANKAAYWLSKGFVFVSTNYRMVPEADPLTQARDVAAAVASVQQHARQWGADPARMVLMGHSAGAHLVSLLGTRSDLLRQAGARRPVGIVSLDSGALDIPALMGQVRVPQLYHDAFGSDPAYWASVSPQQQLGRDALPLLLVCSSTRHFPTSPCNEARKLDAKARLLSVPVEVLPEALPHGEINANLGLPSAYTNAVAHWIDKTLKQIRD